jgi:hypothetical protein
MVETGLASGKVGHAHVPSLDMTSPPEKMSLMSHKRNDSPLYHNKLFLKRATDVMREMQSTND